MKPPSTKQREDLPYMLRVKDVQAILGLSREITYRLVHQPGCPCIRFGGSIRIPRDQFFQWLESASHEQATSPCGLNVSSYAP